MNAKVISTKCNEGNNEALPSLTSFAFVKENSGFRIFHFVVISICAVFLISCTTVIPKHVETAAASFDGNEQNSGAIAFLPDGSVMLTPNAVARYNDLVRLYGAYFHPPLTNNAGIGPAVSVTLTNATYTGFAMDAEHQVRFETMTRWRKEGKPPAN